MEHPAKVCGAVFVALGCVMSAGACGSGDSVAAGTTTDGGSEAGSDGPSADAPSGDASGDAQSDGAGVDASDAAPVAVCSSTYTNISGIPNNAAAGWTPSAVIDTANAKLLVVAQRDQNSGPPVLFRCNLDGTACLYADISAGQLMPSAENPSAVIDTTNAKLLVVFRNGATGGLPAIIRCNLDGTACVYSDVLIQGADSGRTPSAVIDAASGKLLIVTDNGASSDKPALFRCDLDGSGCIFTDISAGQGANTGVSPSAAIDTANGKLLVATNNAASSSRPGLFRCELDGSACTYADISAGQGAETGRGPSLLIDTTTSKLLVVTQKGSFSTARPALFRCNLDGTACTYTDISAGHAGSGRAVIDPLNHKLLVVGGDAASKPFLWRCNLDGSACAYKDISAGQGVRSGSSPSPVFDVASGKLLVVTANAASVTTGGVISTRPALFAVTCTD